VLEANLPECVAEVAGARVLIAAQHLARVLGKREREITKVVVPAGRRIGQEEKE